MATNPYKHQNDEMPQANESASIYYSQPLINALKRNICQKIEDETNLEVLSEISHILTKDSSKSSFEERFRQAKEFAYSHFDLEYAQELEAHNFYIDEPCPLPIIHTQQDMDALIAVCESGEDEEVSHEEVMKMVSAWRSVK
ncbi:MAG: hypothetical protein Q4D56_14685 [Bacteroides sp.]|nr:hypothetical protein [Bacteroides sp.]